MSKARLIGSLPDEVWDEIKHIAITKKLTMQELMREILEQYIKDNHSAIV